MGLCCLFVNMNVLDCFIFSLQELLTRKKLCDNNIIRKHSRKLEELGDISFPLNIKNWYHLIDEDAFLQGNLDNIFSYNLSKTELETQIEELKEKSKIWPINIEKVVINSNNVHLFLKRSSYFLRTVITDVLNKNKGYGSSDIILKKLTLNCDDSIKNLKLCETDLSTLRLQILKDVLLNLVTFTTSNKTKGDYRISLTLDSASHDQTVVLCGPVLNENGIKDSKTTAEELYNKRTSDMRMMAQHRYRVQVKPNSPWKSYFEKLGKAAVTIEMLSNKPHKTLKVSLHNLQTANKGAAFILYNCARLAVLFKELDKRIAKNMYPNLPEINDVDFSLLNQSEEWELFYVYILQFPTIIKGCIKDVDKGIINPQYLIFFLSSLCSVFSAYYRRVRILTDPREHLFATLYARIYLLKALECVFHNALHLLDIEPVKEM